MAGDAMSKSRAEREEDHQRLLQARQQFPSEDLADLRAVRDRLSDLRDAARLRELTAQEQRVALELAIRLVHVRISDVQEQERTHK